MESREAPAQYRTRMNSKIKGYQADLEKFNRDLVSTSTSPPPPPSSLPPSRPCLSAAPRSRVAELAVFFVQWLNKHKVRGDRVLLCVPDGPFLTRELARAKTRGLSRRGSPA